MAKAIIWLLDRKEMCDQLSENAARDARNRFDLNRQLIYILSVSEIIRDWKKKRK